MILRLLTRLIRPHGIDMWEARVVLADDATETVLHTVTRYSEDDAKRGAQKWITSRVAESRRGEVG